MESPATRLIIGLGNPGERYAGTRHNVGFLVVDALAREAGANRWSAEARSFVSPATIAGCAVLLAKPLTYMNLSGQAVKLLLSEHGFTLQDTVLVFDDFNLPFGRIRIRQRGAAGGHHGLESVIRAVESEEFLRVRLGIGEDDAPEDKSEFVLSEFPPALKADLNEMIGRAGEAVKMILTDGAARAMSVFNA